MEEATIGIVGAGAGGMSLAWILKERGIKDVIVLERSDRIGGKTLTIEHQGVPHELGACYMTPGYTRTNRWMKRLGMGACRLPFHLLAKVDGTTQEFTDFAMGDSMLRSSGQLLRYVGYWLAFHYRDQAEGRRPDHDATMGQSFGAWLDQRGLDTVRRAAMVTTTCTGYGHVEDLPALHGLRYNTPSLLISDALTRVYEPAPGWQHLWLRMEPELRVDKNIELQRAERRDGIWRVEAADRQYRFQHLVVTSAPDDAARWLDLGEQRLELFSQFTWHTYVSCLVVIEGWFRDLDSFSIEKNILGANGPRRGHLIIARRTRDKTGTAKRDPSGPEVYVTYQYGGPGLSDAVLLEKLRADVAEHGGRVTGVLGVYPWKYSPTLSLDAIRDGAVSRLRSIQGQDQLWWSGASFSHEAIDNIVDFNVRLADELEAAVRAPERAPLGRAAFRLRTGLRRIADLRHEI